MESDEEINARRVANPYFNLADFAPAYVFQAQARVQMERVPAPPRQRPQATARQRNLEAEVKQLRKQLREKRAKLAEIKGANGYLNPWR